MLCMKATENHVAQDESLFFSLLFFVFVVVIVLFHLLSIVFWHSRSRVWWKNMKEVQGKPFGQRSDWLRTDKVHEYLNSLSIYRFYWTAQNTSPNLMIIHTWFRGLGPVSNVLKPLSGCVGVHWHKSQTCSSNKTQRIKRKQLDKKVTLISFILPPAHFICAENWLRCRIATFFERINPYYNYSTTFWDAYFQNFITSRVIPLTLIQPQSSLSQFQAFRYWTEGGTR